MKNNIAYWIVTGLLMNAFLILGWSGDGGLHRLALIMGGVCAGHMLTEILNYDEREESND
jgi:hypothetical protein